MTIQPRVEDLPSEAELDYVVEALRGIGCSCPCYVHDFDDAGLWYDVFTLHDLDCELARSHGEAPTEAET